MKQQQLPICISPHVVGCGRYRIGIDMAILDCCLQAIAQQKAAAAQRKKENQAKSAVVQKVSRVWPPDYWR